MRINLQILMALLCAFLISCGSGTTTTIFEEETITIVETTGPAVNPVQDDLDNLVNVAVLLPMARTGEDGNILADTVLRLDGISILDGHRAVLSGDDDLIHHVTVGVIADSGNGPMLVTDAKVDDKPLCTGSAVLSNGESYQMNFAGGEVQYTVDLRPFQRDIPTEVELTITGQIDPELAVLDLADRVDLQPPITTTITTTTREWRREETKKKDGPNGAFGLIGLLGLVLNNTPVGASVQLVCGGVGADPVDADTIVFIVPPKYDSESESDPEPENIPPVAVASATPTIGPAPLSVMFDGSASYDTDGTVVSYLWDYGSGGGGNGENPTHIFTEPGTYNVILTVRDNDDATNSTATGTMTITVVEPTVENIPPVAVATATPTTGLAPLSVQFDSSGSYDVDGEIVIRYWSYNDGGGASGLNPVHVFTEPGTYDVILTVYDDDGATDSTVAGAMTITVTEPEVEWREAFITPQNPTIQAPDEMTFSAVLLNEDGEDVTPPGATIEFYCIESPGSIDDGVFYSILSGTGTFTVVVDITTVDGSYGDDVYITVQ